MLLYDNYSTKVLPRAHFSLHYTEENGHTKYVFALLTCPKNVDQFGEDYNFPTYEHDH